MALNIHFVMASVQLTTTGTRQHLHMGNYYEDSCFTEDGDQYNGITPTE